MRRRVQLKVLQRGDDEGVVGRVAKDAVDVASQARVVAHESREAHGDPRPRRPGARACCTHARHNKISQPRRLLAGFEGIDRYIDYRKYHLSSLFWCVLGWRGAESLTDVASLERDRHHQSVSPPAEFESE